MTQCAKPNCFEPARARELCVIHYGRHRYQEVAAANGKTVAPKGSKVWREKISAARKGQPRNQWIDDYFDFMPAKERRKEYARRAKLPRRLYEKKCEWCDEKYLTSVPSRAKYCSHSCADASRHYNEAWQDICAECGIEFLCRGRVKADKHFCSHSCAGRYGLRKRLLNERTYELERTTEGG